MRAESKVFVITGAGNGIGRELTLALLQKGARVAAVDINKNALRETYELAGSLKDSLSTHVVNIADQAAVEKLPQAVITAHHAVDGLINNAGIIQRFVRFKDLPFEDMEHTIDVNFYGMLYMTKAFLPILLERPEAHIVNISSMGGFLPVPGQTLYGASKAAAKLFTEGLYSELLDTNVRVTVVFPGAIATNIAANSGVSIETGGSTSQKQFKTTNPKTAAEEIIKAMERNSFRVLIGQDAKMMDIFSRLMPKGAARLIYKQMGSLLK